ncbi:uncharacterized protein LOC124350615 isoform X2 [Daphnia pulicaria]|uniref:uncharacterized protein LOC124350615 isoform X2 n=1 Tax=Daphnia pulicaria TaxID=35523 RepID=UPI001EEA48E7|nr:uncharacterized protein LOC124350615 isoform X2 [Daphnia pulicaria]
MKNNPSIKGLWLALVLLCWGSLFVSTELTFLNGKHLTVGSQISDVHVFWMRNVSGHNVKIGGVAGEALDALSLRYNFTYSILQVNDSRLEKQSNTLPGLAHYMATGKCDLVIGPIILTPSRLAIMDLAEGYMYTSVALLIPMPKPTDNAESLVKPFQLSVWIGLLIAMPIISVALYFFIRPLPLRMLTSPAGENVLVDPSHDGWFRRSVNTLQVLFEIFRIIMNQGGNIPLMRNAVYFVFGSWCLGAMILGCAYNSVLTSYILGSNAEQLVNSLTDLARKSNVHLVVDKGSAVESVLLAANDGLFKQLGDKLRTQPLSYCTKRQDCIDLVKSGSYAYLQGLFIVANAVEEDFRATGKCNLAIAKETEPISGSVGWALSKNSPYIKIFSKGFMELHQAGLIDFWTQRELQKRKHITHCVNEANKVQMQKVSDSKTKITLNNFSGAFYILLVGYIISFIFFVSENVYLRITKYKRGHPRIAPNKIGRGVGNQSSANQEAGNVH